jgi:hypothetical protein
LRCCLQLHISALLSTATHFCIAVYSYTFCIAVYSYTFCIAVYSYKF